MSGIDGPVLVVGLGTTGRATVRALREAGTAVIAVDEATPGDLAAVRATGAEILAPGRAEQHLDRVASVVVSPGVPDSAPVVARARGRGLPVLSEPELAWVLHAPPRLVGITGTNGKTSVTELTTAMLTAGGADAVACGNIGRPLIAAAGRAGPDTTLVAELSSFQLRFCRELRPRVGALLNVAPDHLDWHGDVERYRLAKARLWRAQHADDWAVVNTDDDVALRLADEHAPGRRAGFSGHRPVPAPGVGVEDGRLVADLPGVRAVLGDVEDLARGAPHDRANVAAAATVALLAGGTPEGVVAAARDFTPGRHRLEALGSRDGVAWVDDSKATNPHAAAAALDALDGVVWIAGGIAKGVDLSVLGDHLTGVRAAVVLGRAAEELAEVCERRGVPATRVPDMPAAVAAAADLARRGDTVLLAPACASFDMFDDYADRGERFAAAVDALGDRRG